MESTDTTQTTIQNWIAASEDIAVAEGAIIRFRGVFKLDRVPVGATLSLAVNGYYRLYVNSVEFGAYCASKSSDDGATVDISAVVKRGVNVIGIQLPHSSPRASLCALVRVQTKTTELTFQSDESWLCSVDPGYTHSICGDGVCEEFNLTAKTFDWLASRFSTRGWSNCVLAEGASALPDAAIPADLFCTTYAPAFAQAFNAPRRAKDANFTDAIKLAAGDEISLLTAGSALGLDELADPSQKKTIKTPRDDRAVAIVVDYDVLMDGRAGISFASDGGGVMDIFFAKTQPADEGVPVADLALGMLRVKFTKGKYDVRSFVSREFRYLRLEFRRCSAPVEIIGALVEVAEVAAGDTTQFECNRTQLSEKWAQYVQKSAGLINKLTTSDSPIELLEAAARAADALWADKTLANTLAEAANQDSTEAADCLSALLTHFEITSDTSQLLVVYPKMLGEISALWDSRRDDGLLHDGNLVHTMPNVKLCRALGLLSKVAWICGKEDEAHRLRDNAATLRKSIMSLLYEQKSGLLFAGLQGWHRVNEYPVDVNIEALQAEIFDQYERSRIRHWLTRPLLGQDMTPVQAVKLVSALLGNKLAEDALETIDSILISDKNAAGEYDYLACLGVAVIVSGILGLGRVPGAAGRYSISPHKVGLKVAKGSVLVDEGRMEIGWRNTRHGLLVQLQIPQDARADLHLSMEFGDNFKLGNRKLTSGIISLKSGSHRISCYETHIPKLKPDESLAPETPWVHVEMLENVSQQGIRTRSGRSPRRRQKVSDTDAPALEGTAPVQQDAPVDKAPPVAEQSSEPADTDTKPKQRGRTRRKKDTAPAQEPQPQPQAAEQSSGDEPEQPAALEVEVPAIIAPPRPRRRRSTRKMDTQIVRPVIDIVSTVEGKSEAADKAQDKKHSKQSKAEPSGRTAKKSQSAKNEVNSPDTKSSDAEKPEKPASKSGGSGRQRSRRTPKPKPAPDSELKPEDTAVPAEPQPEAAEQPQQASDSSAPQTRRRRNPPRKKPAGSKGSSAQKDTAEQGGSKQNPDVK